jgi:regulator of telomere elongation helicase 1
MGVCRGRISEGLNFSDDAARCVIIIGIPYAQYTDPKI